MTFRFNVAGQSPTTTLEASSGSKDGPCSLVDVGLSLARQYGLGDLEKELLREIKQEPNVDHIKASETQQINDKQTTASENRFAINSQNNINVHT